MQIRLSGALKANKHLRGRCWYEGKCFYSGASILDNDGLLTQSWSHHLRMVDSCLKASLSISGVLASLYRGYLERGEQRNFWLYAVSHSVVGWFPWYLLCALSCGFTAPSTVLLPISRKKDVPTAFLLVLMLPHPTSVCGVLPLIPYQAKFQRQSSVEKKGIFYLTII